MPLPRLKNRSQFLLVMQKGESIRTRTMVIQVLRKNKGVEMTPSAAVQVGFTATRKLGGAVVRNRARRRMRAMADEVMPMVNFSHPFCDIVFIARPRLLTSSFSELKDNCLWAFHQLHLS